MFKIKNKFIFFIILLLLSILIFGVFKSFFEKDLNRDSHVVLINGKGLINTNILSLDKKEKLNIGDTVRTVGKDSLLVLEWGDGSITRLGGNGSLKINELYVSDNLGDINISFELLNGKTWSNVISFLGDKSYFKETFENSVAAVRGTIFDINLEKNYLYVRNHSINLTTNGKKIIVNEKQPININNFNLIILEDFINKIKDSDWEKLNFNMDIHFFDGLKEQINKDLNKIVDLSGIDFENILDDNIKKNKLYNQILSDYQKLNFVNSGDKELFSTKLKLKNALIKLSSDENKTHLLNNTLYDFKEIIDSKNYKQLDNILPILDKNKSFIKSFDINNHFKGTVIPEDVKNKLKNSFGDLKFFIGNKVNNGNIINEVKDINDTANDFIQDGLDNLFNK